MNKSVSTIAAVAIAGGIALGVAPSASAHVPQINDTCLGLDVNLSTYTMKPAVPATFETVITTPYQPAVDAVTHPEYIFERYVVDAPYKPAIPAVTEQVVDNPGQPYIAPTYKTVVVTPAVPEQAEESYTKYQYQKQTKTVRERGKKTELVSDWGWWAPASVQWSTKTPEVLESGTHAEWKEGGWDYTRTYRYIKNGVTEKVVTKPFKPGVPAVTKEVVDNPGQPYIAPTYKTVVVSEAVPEVAETGHTEKTDWVLAAPEGDDWEQKDERIVTDVEAVPEVAEVTEEREVTPAIEGDETPNLVYVEIDGKEIYYGEFGESFTKNFPIPAGTDAYDWVVSIDAWDDFGSLEDWTMTFSGDVSGCVPVVTPPVVTPPSVTPPVTLPVVQEPPVAAPPAVVAPVALPVTAAPSTPASVVPTTAKTLPVTGSSTPALMGAALATVLAGLGLVTVSRRRRSQ